MISVDFRLLTSATGIAVLFATSVLADPLPSWTDTEAKSRIMAFVDTVTDPDSVQYVTQSDRIAVFDNDGTLWAEQPVYFQLYFAIDRLRELAEKDPSILKTDVLRSAVAGDLETVAKGGTAALFEILDASHSGMAVADFSTAVRDWINTAKHPDTGMGYDEMTYQPMTELLRYLRDEDFKTYIVSGGGIHFLRVFAEEAYGIPPEQVLGTYTNVEYQVREGKPVIVKTPGIAFVDDKDGKPINIERTLGKRPIFAAGNSDGDFAMLEWTTAGDGPRFGMLVHHNDALREYAYDRDSHIGRLNDGLDKGPDLGWLIVDMAKDWSRIYTGTK